MLSKKHPFSSLRSLGLLAALALAPQAMAQQFEAEAWTTMSGLQTEATTDAGGGQNVGWIDANDWAEYANKAIAPGNYRVELRIATMATNRQVQIWVDGTNRTTYTHAASTGGWQTWVTALSAQFNIASGATHTVRLVFPVNNMNINWFRFVNQSADATPPSVPSGLNSPSKTNTMVTLSWTASTDNVGVASYDIYRNGTLAGSVNAPATTYLLTGLAANTAYNLTVLAKDAAGNASAPSSALSVTTANVANLLTNGDFAAGLAPWAMFAGTNLNIAGQYAVNSPATTNVYDVNLLQVRALTQGTPYTLTFRARSNVNRTIVGGWGLAQAPWTNQNNVFPLTTAWTLYTFAATSTVPTLANSRVFFDVGGPTAGEVHIDDVTLSAGGQPPDTQAPTVPANLASPSKTNTTVNLTWTASTDNVGVTGYDVYQNGVIVGSPATNSYQATGLTANTSYNFTVRAKDAANNFSAQTAALSVTTTGPDISAPSQPTNLASPSKTNTTVNLAWTASTDNVGVTGYDVLQGAAVVGSPATNSFQVTGLTANTAYSFTVRAKDAAGNLSLASAALNVTTDNADQTAPSAPGNLTSSGQTPVAITLNWIAATDNVGVTSYDLYRNGAFLLDLGNVTSYTAAGLTPNTAYTFYVRAKDAAGNVSVPGNTLSISTPADQTAPSVPANLAASGLTQTGVTLTWTASTDLVGVTGYDIYRGGAAFGTSTAATFTTNALTAGTAYSFTVRAKDAAGNLSAFTAALPVTTPSNPPQNNLLVNGDFATGLAPWAMFAGTNLNIAGEYAVNAPVTTNVYDVNLVQILPLTQGTTYTLTFRARSNGNKPITAGFGLAEAPWTNNNQVFNLTATWNTFTFTAASAAPTLANSRVFFDVGGPTAGEVHIDDVVLTSNQPPQPSLTIQAETWSRMLGLQTEATTDAGGGLNVGWIDALDWAEYDNQNIPAGTYKLEARMATMAAGRQVQLSIDGVLATTVTMAAATGGWQTWGTAVSNDFTVTGGPNHMVRLGFPLNNMNINWVRFVPSGPDATAPTVPANLASPSQTGTVINLTWTGSTDNVGVAGYEIWVNGAFRSTVTGPVQAGQVTGLTPSTQYSIHILAFDAAGNKSGNSNTLTVSTTDGSNLAGIYALRNRNSNLCVEVAGGGVANGDPVIQNVCNGSRAQKWEFAPSATAGYYTLKNVNSGKMLDVKDAGAGDDLQQWDAGGNSAQDYSVQAAATAGHHTLKARSGLTECLDILNGSTAPGTILRTVLCAAGSASQNFALVPTEATTACVAGAPATSTIATQEIWGGQGFVQPMELVQEPAASGTRFVVMDKTGMARLVNEDPADNVTRTFFNMNSRLNLSGESGLASLVFDPQYGAGNRFVYVTYINANPFELRLSRFTANATGTSVDLATEVRLFSFARTSDIHHSGALAFGPGPVAGQTYLYFSVGDNGNNAAGDLSPVKVTQNTQPHGKVLRLTQAEYRSSGPLAWDFNNGNNNLHYIAATGLRNPWRMSFDGNNIWVSNVGFDKYEEVNMFDASSTTVKNFGWPWCEGPVCCEQGINCNLAGMPAMPNNLELPVHYYHRNEGTTGEGAVIGGFVYRGTTVPALTGKYVFAEFVDGLIYALDPVTRVRTTILTGAGNVADIGQDRNGEILLTDYGRSNVYRIVPGAGGPTLPWPPANLADAGCFESLNNGNPIPKPSVARFNVAQKFWSDAADKERMISVPAGARVDVANQDDWMLPPGGVTIKNFFWNGSIFETRLFVRHNNGAHAGYTYKWNGPNSATLVTTENDTKDLGGGKIWKYPSRAQCMECHRPEVSGSIALESRQMNVGSQINTLTQLGMLSAPIPSPHPPFPDHLDWTVPLQERAMAYMHVNCANCHRGPSQPRGQATWDARYSVPLASKVACDETPKAGAISGNPAERIIKPQDPDLSTVWLRAHVRGASTGAMPPLGSDIPDAGGVAMLRDWITALNGCQ